jgi:ribosomal protein L12E/L44/L45/RPP1/RPP2
MTPEHQLKVEQWRAQAAAGTLSKADCIEIIAELRKARGALPVAADKPAKTPKPATAKKPVVSGDDLLGQLDLL